MEHEAILNKHESELFETYYYTPDHQGNIRQVQDGRGNIVQQTNYYPFGTPYKGTHTIDKNYLQPYLYNGKELDRMHGLDWYDYGARMYDPIIGRWTNIDPLAEKYYNINPYAYCADNPVRYIDPDGARIKTKWWIDERLIGFYQSPNNFREAFSMFAATEYGRQLIADFTPKGSYFFGVPGNGKYAKYNLDLYLYQYQKEGFETIRAKDFGTNEEMQNVAITYNPRLNNNTISLPVVFDMMLFCSSR